MLSALSLTEGQQTVFAQCPFGLTNISGRLQGTGTTIAPPNTKGRFLDATITELDRGVPSEVATTATTTLNEMTDMIPASIEVAITTGPGEMTISRTATEGNGIVMTGRERDPPQRCVRTPFAMAA